MVRRGPTRTDWPVQVRRSEEGAEIEYRPREVTATGGEPGEHDQGVRGIVGWRATARDAAWLETPHVAFGADGDVHPSASATDERPYGHIPGKNEEPRDHGRAWASEPVHRPCLRFMHRQQHETGSFWARIVQP
jgi:hypothetical protein